MAVALAVIVGMGSFVMLMAALVEAQAGALAHARDFGVLALFGFVASYGALMVA